MTASDAKLNGAFWLLRVAVGAGMLLAGADKFFDLLTAWSMYLSPLAERLLPVRAEVFLRAVGVAEVALGVAVLWRWTRLGAYAVAAWLVAIAANLAVTAHFWDLVVRDLEVASGAFALARLAEWRAAVLGAAAPSAGHPALREERTRARTSSAGLPPAVTGGTKP